VLLGNLAQFDGLALAGAREQEVDLALFPLDRIEQAVEVVEIGRVTAHAVPSFILIKADQKRTLALHNTMQALASEMAEQAPGSEVVASRLAEVLFIQVLRTHIASGPERNKGWLRAVFDPQIGTALIAIHDRVNTPWTVESLADAAGMSRSAFAARFKELLGQTPLEYVTGWRMQKAMQLLEQRDKKLIDVARSVGYESGAAFSKAFKRVVGANPGEYLKRGLGHQT
jgi:AraC-like DNA-binding protein